MCYEPPKQQVWLGNQCQNKYATENLIDVLDCLNLAKYYSCFENEDVDMETFLTLNDEELKQIGIKYVYFILVFLHVVVTVLILHLATDYN